MKRIFAITSTLIMVGGLAFNAGLARAAEGAGSSEPASVSIPDAGVQEEVSKSPDQGAPAAEASQTDASAAAAEPSAASAAGEEEANESNQAGDESESAEDDSDADN
jgi:hypothetical protein